MAYVCDEAGNWVKTNEPVTTKAPDPNSVCGRAELAAAADKPIDNTDELPEGN